MKRFSLLLKVIVAVQITADVSEIKAEKRSVLLHMSMFQRRYRTHQW